MPTTYQIPRQSDREIIAALGRVRKGLRHLHNFELRLTIPKGPEVNLTEDEPETNKSLEFILKNDSEVLDHIHFRGPQNQTVLSVNRAFDKVCDKVTVNDEWPNYIDDKIRSQLWVDLCSSLRKELKATDVEAALKGQDDTAWNRYRDAQMAVVNSLQQASETLLIKTADKNAELDRARSARFEQLEKDLRQEISDERKKLLGEFEAKGITITDRTKELTDREAAFNTKESRYVSRQKQGEQIKQIQDWLNDWHLTEGTRKKRTPIFWSYITALVLTGILTGYSVYHSYDLLKSADDLEKLQWWHWGALTLKTFLPLGAFTTFMVYFIRWSGDWANQHAKEEFRNRTLLIDIGRSSWLLEAVRDAHERNKEIPVDLLKELSRNLFANNPGTDLDVHPQAAADILLQGLSSIRVKSPDGGEVEAKREK